MKALEKFFNDYAIASMSKDPNRVAGFYAQNFIAATKDQSSAFSNDDKFIEWLKDIFRFNEKAGLQQMTVKNIEATKVGKYFYRATVKWTVVYKIKPTQKIDFDIHYILNQVEDGYKIVLYISDEDQEQLMKEKGVL